MTVYAEGVDYAFSWPSPAGLAAAGKRFVMRYVGPGSADKLLTAAERDAIWAAGLELVLLVEGAANGAMGGAAAGAAHARLGRAHATTLGLPSSAPLYYAVDWDVTAAQWPTVVAYLRGAASVDGGAAQVGVYGGIRAMQWAARDKVAAWFFQTYAWSSSQWWPGNHVEQYHNGVALAGGNVDLCRAKQPFFGQISGDDDMALSDSLKPYGGLDTTVGQALTTLLVRTDYLANRLSLGPRLDAILAAALDDGNSTVVLSPEALAQLQAIRDDVHAVPAAVLDAEAARLAS